MKRLLDLAGSIAGLVLLAPLLALAALAVKLSSPGPVFYRARRAGRLGVPFEQLKFRSMRVNDGNGPAVTAKGDRRVTRVGAVLRKTKIDELPQLLNVLRGEMSLVGPRPEAEKYVALYSAEQRRVLDFKPGITGAASVQFRDEEQRLTGADWETLYINEIMPEKARL
ncbi:MAG: sugar transferase, partial [Acidobacteriota bacterium]